MSEIVHFPPDYFHDFVTVKVAIFAVFVASDLEDTLNEIKQRELNDSASHVIQKRNERAPGGRHPRQAGRQEGRREGREHK